MISKTQKEYLTCEYGCFGLAMYPYSIDLKDKTIGKHRFSPRLNKMHKALCTFHIVLLCITLILLLATLGKLKKQENFKTCVCSSASSERVQVCQDVNVVDAMYRDGKATELPFLEVRAGVLFLQEIDR